MKILYKLVIIAITVLLTINTLPVLGKWICFLTNDIDIRILLGLPLYYILPYIFIRASVFFLEIISFTYKTIINEKRNI